MIQYVGKSLNQSSGLISPVFTGYVYYKRILDTKKPALSRFFIAFKSGISC